MKKLFFLLFILSAGMLSGCKESAQEYVTYTTNEPIFMSASEFRSSVAVKDQPQAIKQQGKIVFFNNYLYISEPGKGIHIIDNRDPKSPKNIAFIELLGNADMHVRNNLLYADSFIDLVWFDISNPVKPVLKGRKEEVFPQALPPIDNQYGYDYFPNNREKGVVVGWKVVEKKVLVENYNSGWWFGVGSNQDASFENLKGNRGVGIVGSMSRFAIYKDNLYTIINNYLGIFNIAAETPVKIGEDIGIGFNAETIFTYKDYLFFGTPTGMIIYSVQNPVKPEYQSRVVHILGCDPVVVENDVAYVTVRSGDFCGQNVDQLMIIEVKDVKHPKPIVTYAMKGPKGLGIDNGTLFICDDGLKVFDAKNPLTVMANQLAHFKDMDGLDVIPYNKVLMMIAENGIYQYDYSDIKNIKQLSMLPIGK